MIKALLGRKREMSQIWDENGKVIPVTILEAGPCVVTQVKSVEGKDGYSAYQIGFEEKNKGVSKALLGHFKKNSVNPQRRLKEYRSSGQGEEISAGTTLHVDVFEVGNLVDVIGRSKGRGFQGGMKRYGFKSGPRSHGSKNVREPGSTGQATTPGRVFKGKRMPGHMGSKQITARNLEIVKIDTEQNLLFVKGAVPGHNNGEVFIRARIAGSRRKKAKS